MDVRFSINGARPITTNSKATVIYNNVYTTEIPNETENLNTDTSKYENITTVLKNKN